MANANVDGGSTAAEKTDPYSYKLLVSCPHGISRHQVDVVFYEKCDRVPHPDAVSEPSMNEIWDRKVQQNKSLFDGTKFRNDFLSYILARGSRHINPSVDGDVDRGLVNKNVSAEMFDSIIREVAEEIGVPAESLSDLIFIGISLREINIRPAAFFYIKCNLLPEAVSHFYDCAPDGKSDAYEGTRDMPGCHRGGYALYELMLQAKNDV